ncbi:anaphase-promoting complex, cyclosome, subunit 4-domain-containing protein [Podospora fimiseda]|uniref:Anaphase-promoting complex subunit 4 n=1 Tax=Podospora fimiseda TaxID=252190 RepID=A0AAN7H0J9_9PEZI|nr:anaphase-promoting complex, cyclosome, subunit 4-domain-containing protein [Podospora fimiseda]
MFLFSTTVGLEFVFKPLRAEDADDVHVMVVGMEGGGIHLSIYDSFVIGTFRHDDPKQKGTGTVYELCGHSSRPEISTHMLLMKPQGVDIHSLRLVPMDLTFVHHSPVNLSLLASKVTTLQNLLRYVKQAQSHMAGEWKGTRELPSRFLLAVQDDLAKMNRGGNGELTVVQALYHTVVTGHVFPPVKEWLLDSVAERGHKRWEKAVFSGLMNLRSLVHENFIPALERSAVILSRLLGIARFHESNEIIGFKAAEISKLIDIVSCLMVVAHKVLLHVMIELEHFTAFSVWLRMEIDKQSSSSGPSEELTEKEATMDNVKVLRYIQRYLISSPLAIFFDEGAKEDFVQNEALAEGGTSLLQFLDRELQKQEQGQEYMKALPHIEFLVKYLDKKACNVFENIAEAEKRGVRFGQATEISIGEKIWKHDVLLCAPSDSLGEAITAVVPERSKNIVYLFQTSVEITNGLSDTPFTLAIGVRLPAGVTIIDLGFLNGKSLLALCHIEREPKYALVRIAYHKIQCEAYMDGRPPQVMDVDFGPILEQYGFGQLSGFTPVQMEVLRGSGLGGEMPARVCLMGRDKAMYKTYKLPKELDGDGLRESREGEDA